MNPAINYEVLRPMEQFTQDMFNRLIEFQEKEHPAWNATLPFAERIKGLPLHNLIFSNPDRDPARNAATVAAFYPLRHEMKRIAHYCRQVTAAPVVCDVACGNGFVGSLLAREGVRVIGVRPPELKPNQIVDFFDAEVFELRAEPIAAIDFPFDVAFNAWMPSGLNLTPEILRHRPKLLVLIFTEHRDVTTGQRQTGTDAAYNEIPAHYKLIEEWTLERPENLLREVWPDLTGNFAETRHVRIYADTPYHDISARGYAAPAVGYDWEADLEMAQTAYAGKQELRARGLPVDKP